MFSICLTFYNKKILKISAMYYWSSATTQSQHGRKEPLSSSTTPYYLVLRSQKCRRKGWSRLDLSLVPQFRILSFFVVPHLKEKSDNIIIHVGTNNAPRFSPYEMFQDMQSLRNFILKYLPSTRITISTPVLRVDKANANDINKAFTELVKESNLDYISHENKGILY